MKLHLGCGTRFFPGWVHVDIQKLDHVDIVHPAEDLPMIEDNTADLVYASNLLEHFPRAQAPAVVGEWKRVLKPSGVLRIAVPNLREWARYYLEDGDLSVALGSIYGRQNHPGNIHYTGYDERSLGALLVFCGLKDVHLYDWKKTEHAHIDDLSQTYIPHLQKETGQLMSLNMEGTKP
jgi:SAM-dependent methyltransferase